VILLRGPTRTIRELADSLIGTKGVETGRLVLTSATPIPDRGEGEGKGKDAAHGHSHAHYEHGADAHHHHED
jgi:CopG family nickel-responsive transcriptional regulator